MSLAEMQAPIHRDEAAIAAVVEGLRATYGDRLSTSQAVREQHGHTTTWLKTQAPDAVVFAQSTEEVSDIVKRCAARKVPVIAFGAGSSLEGHVNAPGGGVCIDLSQMNAILEVNAEDLDCKVQAGVTRKQLNTDLRDSGLFFPIDPGADATIGGMTATRASGTNAVRYGTMKDAVLGLTVVTATGAVIHTGGRARKSSAGYDLTRLFVGSEGTLGIVTEITLKLFGQPEAISGGMCSFPSIKAACDAVIMTIQCGLPVARIELLDPLQVRACNIYSKLTLPEEPTLFLEFHGSESGVREQAETFGGIAEEFGGSEFRWATKAEDRTALWQARHDAYWASFTLRPGAKGVATDVCVPISRLADCVAETQRDLDENKLLATIVGHVGDGNFHVLVLVDEEDAGEVERAEAFVGRLNGRAIDFGGTCTGEHGIGQGKMKYMVKEHGPALDVMRAVKQALDPDRILNPGKILPEA
ncbi:FAD-binding oxidoreductase [Roseibium aestuarii]|uniref:D-lactate dehydrogenase (cytochrome) n=1 Tax=Roseibium aestuarii TaxID=2600299 RepID=A0ABW4JWK3_9HYPH|nr:FAD-linked oxidase C-terminal domain-containing protein [Roseibium aestuarii]